MDKVLLIGSSYSSLPILEYLKMNNYKVAVIGSRKNDPAHFYADESYYVDYSKKSELLKICLMYEPDYIIPSCNDYAYNSASYVNSKLGNVFKGFDPYKITMLLHTKHLFRKFLIENNIPSPKEYSIEEVNENFNNYPILLKPSNSFSGRGIRKINNYRDFMKYFSNEIGVIEEFVDGDLYSYSAFIENKKVKKGFLVREFCLTYPYQVDFSYIDSNVDNRVIKEIVYYIEKIASILNLKDGLFHSQIIINDSNFFFIEVMRRCPGDLYNVLIEKSTGFNYIQNYVNAFLGKGFSLKERFNKKIIRHTITSSNSMCFKSLLFKGKMVEFFPLKESGQVLKEAPYDKVGIIFKEVKNLNDIDKRIKDKIYLKYYGV